MLYFLNYIVQQKTKRIKLLAQNNVNRPTTKLAGSKPFRVLIRLVIILIVIIVFGSLCFAEINGLGVVITCVNASSL